MPRRWTIGQQAWIPEHRPSSSPDGRIDGEQRSIMISPHEVSFPADGITIAGHLHTSDRPSPGPAVLIAGPPPQVKEQAADTYAVRFAAAGLHALTIDHRNFGSSGGAPPLRGDPAGQIAGLRAAVSFLRARPDIDPERVAVVGVCAGAGYALKAAASDPRIRAFVGIAGFYPSVASLREAMGGQGYRQGPGEESGGVAVEGPARSVAWLAHAAR